MVGIFCCLKLKLKPNPLNFGLECVIKPDWAINILYGIGPIYPAICRILFYAIFVKNKTSSDQKKKNPQLRRFIQLQWYSTGSVGWVWLYQLQPVDPCLLLLYGIFCWSQKVANKQGETETERKERKKARAHYNSSWKKKKKKRNMDSRNVVVCDNGTGVLLSLPSSISRQTTLLDPLTYPSIQLLPNHTHTYRNGSKWSYILQISLYHKFSLFSASSLNSLLFIYFSECSMWSAVSLGRISPHPFFPAWWGGPCFDTKNRSLSKS